MVRPPVQFQLSWLTPNRDRDIHGNAQIGNFDQDDRLTRGDPDHVKGSRHLTRRNRHPIWGLHPGDLGVLGGDLHLHRSIQRAAQNHFGRMGLAHVNLHPTRGDLQQPFNENLTGTHRQIRLYRSNHPYQDTGGQFAGDLGRAGDVNQDLSDGLEHHHEAGIGDLDDIALETDSNQSLIANANADLGCRQLTILDVATDPHQLADQQIGKGQWIAFLIEDLRV